MSLKIKKGTVCFKIIDYLEPKFARMEYMPTLVLNLNLDGRGLLAIAQMEEEGLLEVFGENISLSETGKKALLFAKQ